MGNNTEIVPLSRNARDVLRFLKVSYGIYRDDPHWVAPLLMDLKKVFTDENPLFEHAEMALWVATRDGQDVGRIAGILDQNHNRMQKDNAAFFGFFECVNDAAVSRRLFEAMFAWARQQGAQRVLGPMNPTTNDECGLLVDGFDSPPVFMMTYNPRLLRGPGGGGGVSQGQGPAGVPHGRSRSARSTGWPASPTRPGSGIPEMTFTPVRKATLTQDLAKVKEVYNAAWQDNWGFVPMTDAEIDFMAARLKPLLMEGLIWVAETPEEPVGFMLALPDYNIALKPLRGHAADPEAAGLPALRARAGNARRGAGSSRWA